MDSLKIKNYTTSISASKTIAEIEEMLAGTGADTIMKTYRGDGRIEAISFKLKGRGYKLPSNTEKCEEALFGKHSQAHEEQAERVAWRVIKDWLHAQFSLIKIGQAEVEQVMLPYMYDGKQTFYERIKDSKLMLPEEHKEGAT